MDSDFGGQMIYELKQMEVLLNKRTLVGEFPERLTAIRQLQELIQTLEKAVEA